jgi:uncharacterized delta-60 repeat protein
MISSNTPLAMNDPLAGPVCLSGSRKRARRVSLPVRGQHIASNGFLRMWLIVVALAIGASASAQELDTQFAPSFNGIVAAIARQSDGTIIVGGEFDRVDGQARYAVACLTNGGALLPPFPNEPTNVVRAIAVDGNNRIVIAGRFKTMTGGFATPLVARLKADGTLDTGFVSGLIDNGFGEVDWVGVLPNGQIVVTGLLSTPSGSAHIALLNADGSIDSHFDGGEFETVNAMAVTPNNQILIAGDFEAQDETCISECVIRLNLDGSLDTSFSTTHVEALEHMSLQANGRILVTGGISEVDTHVTYYVGRIMPNGGADTSFTNSDIRYASMERIQEQADGKILIAGLFRWQSAGQSLDRVARLSTSGARDTSYNEPLFGSRISDIFVSTNSEFIVGGYFETAAGAPRSRLARFLTKRPDPVFKNGFD